MNKRANRHVWVPVLCLLVVLLSFSACVSEPSQSGSELIGTWRWVSIDGHRTPHPFYARYYPGGKVATWPSPREWSSSQGVSKGHYAVENGFLILDQSYGQRHPKARIVVGQEELVLTNGRGNRLLYRRLKTNLEPGRLENGAPAGYLREAR